MKVRQKTTAMKTFEELISGIGCNEPEDLFDYPDISDEEVDIRAQVFLNGWREAEKVYRKLINNLSFQLNKKLVEGYQSEDLIEFYNERVGAILDDFIF